MTAIDRNPVVWILRYAKGSYGKELIYKNRGHAHILLLILMLIGQDLPTIEGQLLGIVFLLGETLSLRKLKGKM